MKTLKMVKITTPLSVSIKLAKLHAEAITRAKYAIQDMGGLGACGSFTLTVAPQSTDIGLRFHKWLSENHSINHLECHSQSYEVQKTFYTTYASFMFRKGINIKFKSWID